VAIGLLPRRGHGRTLSEPFENVMNNRERLPNRRAAETLQVEINGLRYAVTVGRFSDGRIGEIFIQNSKPGSTSDCYMRDAGISASLALQYGCPLETLRRALLRDPRGAPSTPLGCVLDLLAGQEVRP